MKTPSSITVWPMRFKPWAGEPIKDTYGGKAVLDSDGQPAFAEIAILQLLEKDGYEGVWVDTYRRRFRNAMPPAACELPPQAREMYDRIVTANGGKRGGCWDVLAWKNREYLFVEAKRKDEDSMRAGQLRWLDAATRAGLKSSCFRICEWDI